MISDVLRRLTGAFALLSAALASVAPAHAAAIEGTWRAPNGAEISVAPCPEGFCGTLSWIVMPKEQSALCSSMPKEDFAPLILDYKNQNKSLQTRSLLGVRMLTLKPTNEPEGYYGTVYNAEEGKSYDVLIWILKGNTLRLGGGCLANFCAVTQDWPRVADRETVPDFTCDG